MASEICSSDIPVYTRCELENHAGQSVKFDSKKYWHGNGDPPEEIKDDQHPVIFRHNADAKGSIGGIAYILEDKLKWIIAWSNSENEYNKVYTQIIQGNKAIDWAQIEANLDLSGNQSSDHNKFGYTSEAVITDNEASSTATLKAILRPVY